MRSLRSVAPWLGAWALSSCDRARLDFASLAGGDETHESSASTSPADGTRLADASEETDVVPGGTSGGIPINSRTDGGAPLRDASLAPSAAEPELLFDGGPVFSDYVRLTHQQWENSVVAILKLTEPTGYVENLTADAASRYTNNESVLVVGAGLAMDYQVAAAAIAARVASDPDALARVSAATDAATFIAEVGRRFYRRPLTAAERATFLDLYQAGETLAEGQESTFAAGVQLLLEVWLQAPHFLYRVEHSEGLLNGYEVATRLAFTLTDTTPSDALLDAAEAGELDNASGVADAAAALLATSPATPVFRRFHDETFALGRLTTFEVDAEFGLNADLNLDLTESTHHFFDRQFGEGLGLRELLLSEVAFVNANLAPLYGVAAPKTATFEPVTVGGTRRGLFAQLPFLMLDSLGETPDAFGRGGMLVRNLLCQGIPEHPGGLPVPPLPAGKTNREHTTELVAATECAACHRYIDPFGLAFEHFDGLGRARSHDNDSPVDSSGSYPFDEGRRFEDSTELMAILSESPLAHGCYAKQLTEFSLARSLDANDAPLVAQLRSSSLEENASLAALVTAIVSSETFRSSKAAP